MRDLRSGTPVTPMQRWCDGVNARICWARHTSHTSRPIFISGTKSISIPLPRGCVRAATVQPELRAFAVTAVAGVTRPANPGVSVATPLSRWHGIFRRRRRDALSNPSDHHWKKCLSSLGARVAERNRRMHRPWGKHATDRRGCREGGASSCCAAANPLSRHKTAARAAPVGARATVMAGVCRRGA